MIIAKWSQMYHGLNEGLMNTKMNRLVIGLMIGLINGQVYQTATPVHPLRQRRRHRSHFSQKPEADAPPLWSVLWIHHRLLSRAAAGPAAHRLRGPIGDLGGTGFRDLDTRDKQTVVIKASGHLGV